MLRNIKLYNIVKLNLKIKPKEINIYSYGKFIRENPKATKNERRKAIKKFLDSTRN